MERVLDNSTIGPGGGGVSTKWRPMLHERNRTIRRFSPMTDAADADDRVLSDDDLQRAQEEGKSAA